MPKGIIGIDGPQFQTGRNAASPLSPFGRESIVARSLTHSHGSTGAPPDAFYTEIGRMIDRAIRARTLSELVRAARSRRREHASLSGETQSTRKRSRDGAPSNQRNAPTEVPARAPSF